MADRIAQVQDALTEAGYNGWEKHPEKSNALRRIVEHSTSDHAIRSGWWPQETYSSVEFLTFIFGHRNQAPKVVHAYSRCPWIAKRDVSVSFKRALELLAQPVAESEIHN